MHYTLKKIKKNFENTVSTVTFIPKQHYTILKGNYLKELS